ncbi:hypothetical protein UFOVP1054_4 [uncultured Caudovirales phage]|uniref:Uncharacterized protein n=1 Tax=uncultured Caudovirales phage TaxID=2100421 RepID=A0A6J5QFQ8_9CAUD|nr:hypothetical protein UFOVP1054_4 [uncultured Caudovirales phage]
MAFNLDDYEPVQSRFSRFIEWAETKEQFFAVISEILTEPGADTCVIKTSILADGVVVATGHAEEVRNQGNVNKTSHVENCETSSLGRCLSNFPMYNFCGSSIDKRPSREEMGKVQRMSESGNGTVTENGNLASEKQMNMIRAVCKSMGKVPPHNLQSFSKREASSYIDSLKNGEQPAPTYDSPEEPF